MCLPENIGKEINTLATEKRSSLLAWSISGKEKKF
jgi:hypothetical protein